MGNKKIDWLNHTLEFLVVLVGIVIAFQLNKCSDRESKNTLINDHLQYIHTESEENKLNLEVSVDHIERQIKNCDTLLLEIANKKNIVSIRNLSTKLLDMRNTSVVEDAYQVLVQSGDIRYLEDYDKKRAIISLYNSLEDIEKINQTHLNLYDQHFYPYLKENFDLVNWRYVDIQSPAEKEKYYSKEFANTVSTYRFLLSSKLRTYKNELQKLEEYIN